MDNVLLFAAAAAAAADEKPLLELLPRLHLSTMNFLEFAVWGAWFVVLGQYLNSLKFTGRQIGGIYATMSLGSIFGPIIAGSLADRYVSAQILMAVLHLLGAGLLFWMAQLRTPRKFYWVALLYALIYSPTLSLSAQITFAHVPDGGRDFPTIRVLGTIGWIAANLCLKFILKRGEPVSNRPLILASCLSAILGLYSFALPDTPPNPKPGSITLTEGINLALKDGDLSHVGQALPFFDALKVLNNPADHSFAVFFGVSFVITIALAFYYSFTSLFLEQQIRVQPQNVGPLMTIGQWSEIGFLLALPFFIKTFGVTSVLATGMAAWTLRYAIFAVKKPFPLILLGLALHGICYDFFFATGFIYVDKTFPRDLAGSGQALFGALTYGLGMYIGTVASGWTYQALTTVTVDAATGQEVRTTNWTKFWLIPFFGSLVSLATYLVLTFG